MSLVWCEFSSVLFAGFQDFLTKLGYSLYSFRHFVRKFVVFGSDG